MKLSEYRGEDALDLLADMLEPTATILADRKIWELARGGKKIDGIKYAIKEYKKEIIEILASIDGVPASEYKCNVFTLPMRVLDIVNDEELQSFFISQFQNMDETSFGTATEIMQETEGR